MLNTDIDECKENKDICPKTKPVCLNLQGSYTCQTREGGPLISGPPVTCPAGYKFNTALQNCEGKIAFFHGACISVVRPSAFRDIVLTVVSI